jgi:precorrin-4 methylase
MKNIVLMRGVDLMSKNTKIGIVTAAGYTEAEKYYGRLHGLLEAVKASTLLTETQKQNLIIMGKCPNPSSFTICRLTTKKAANQTSSSPTPPPVPTC